MQHNIPKEVSVDFYNGPNPEYYFIIKELAKEFKKQFTCLGENIEKWIIFLFPMQNKVTRIGKKRKEITVYWLRKIQNKLIIKSYEYFAEGIHKI